MKSTDIVFQINYLVFSLLENIFQVEVVSVQGLHVVFQAGDFFLKVQLACFEVDDFQFEIFFHSSESFVPVFELKMMGIHDLGDFFFVSSFTGFLLLFLFHELLCKCFDADVFLEELFGQFCDFLFHEIGIFLAE